MTAITVLAEDGLYVIRKTDSLWLRRVRLGFLSAKAWNGQQTAAESCDKMTGDFREHDSDSWMKIQFPASVVL
ncbi:hypothetical protein OAF83_02420 [Rubripirellula sp.]|nr:hypothetical protein [Rubripirellula sp.]MDB4749739.1 hypothetical protein [Rubripirellula sp.]